MSLDREGEHDGKSAAERLSELTGEDAEDFEYDGAVPKAEEQEWEEVDE